MLSTLMINLDCFNVVMAAINLHFTRRLYVIFSSGQVRFFLFRTRRHLTVETKKNYSESLDIFFNKNVLFVGNKNSWLKHFGQTIIKESIGLLLCDRLIQKSPTQNIFVNFNNCFQLFCF